MKTFHLKYIFHFFFIVILLIQPGCDNYSKPAIQDKLGHDASLSIKPVKAARTGTVAISFPKQHPANIAIRTPAGEWFTIHSEAEKILLVVPPEYRKATSISFQLSEVKGVKWVDGKKIMKKVFLMPGEYLIYMADNLETEPENTFFISGTLTVED